jgi:4-amino-4-deoxy-L-arabinose transferase-like glycosyltransferase
MDRRIAYPIMFLLLVSIGMIDGLSARHKSLTYDEPMHYRYGAQILDGDSDRFVDGTMPVSALNASLRKIADAWPDRRVKDLLSPVPRGRCVTIAFAIILGAVIYMWASRLYGRGAGLLSLTLYALSPNLIAHSRLITTDVFCAGMMAISTYCFWRFLRQGGWRRGLTAAAAVGLSQLTKYTCVLIYPLLLLMAFVYCSGELRSLVRTGSGPALARRVGKFLVWCLVFLAVGAMIVNAGFLLNRTFTPLADYEFRSETFTSLQSELKSLARLPVPLPYPFLEGIDWGKFRVETGRGYGKMYLLGELREIGGFRGYYLFAYLYKVPLAIQAFTVAALALLAVRWRWCRIRENEIFLVIPVVMLSLYFNLLFSLQIGIRHFLVVFPFLLVICGGVAKLLRGRGPAARIATAGLLAYLAVSTLSYFPHYIPYFNELVWDRKQAYRILADSNIDWGQDYEYVRRFRADHPEAYYDSGLWGRRMYRNQHMEEFLNPAFPDSGLVVVSVNNLVGIHVPERYRWLRDSYQPVGHIGYSHLVFEVSGKHHE